MRIANTLVVLAAVLLSLVIAPTVRADGLVRDGVGPISIGRGGTNLAFADNAAIILDNPAGMSNVRGTRLFEFGVDTLIADLNYSDPDNPSVHNIVHACPDPQVGYIWRSPGSCWTYGIGAFAPIGFSAKYNMDNPFTGPAQYESLGMLVKLLPAVAYQWSDRLSIGASLGVALGHTELEGPFFVQTGPFAGTPTVLDFQSTGAAVTGSIGLQYAWSPQTTFGIAYTEQTQVDMDGNARATLITPLGNLDSTFDAEARLTWPRSLGIGVKHDLCCCRRLGIDLIWYDWSDAFDQFDLRFSEPSNPVVGAVLGPRLTDAFPMRWNDSVSLRLGYEWDASRCWTWRAGYVFHESPVPADTLNPYLDGILEHAFSLGCTWRRGRGDVNFAYQYSFGPEEHVADSSIVGGDFDDSDFSAQAHWIALSWSVLF